MRSYRLACRRLGHARPVQLGRACDSRHFDQFAALHLEGFDQVEAEDGSPMRMARRGTRPTTSSRLRAISFRKGKSSYVSTLT